jgi:hypothetical protein
MPTLVLPTSPRLLMLPSRKLLQLYDRLHLKRLTRYSVITLFRRRMFPLGLNNATQSHASLTHANLGSSGLPMNTPVQAVVCVTPWIRCPIFGNDTTRGWYSDLARDFSRFLCISDNCDTFWLLDDGAFPKENLTWRATQPIAL